VIEQTFGERLRVIRKRRGMTQGDLAKALGCTVQTVVRYEGLTLEEVKPARLRKIADALHVDERELTGDYGDEGEIGVLTRGLKNMEPERRSQLIQLMMPLVMHYQRGGAEQNHEESDT